MFGGLYEVLAGIQRFLWMLHMSGLIFLTLSYNELNGYNFLLPPVLGVWVLNWLTGNAM